MTGRRRIKWEPPALMALVLALGLWIAFGPTARPSVPLRPGARTPEVRIGHERGLLEAAEDPRTGEYTFRLLMPGASEPPPPTIRAEAERTLGPKIVAQAIGTRRDWVF